MTKSTIRTIALFPLKRPAFSLLSLLCLATLLVWGVTWGTFREIEIASDRNGTTTVGLGSGRGDCVLVWAADRKENEWEFRIDWLDISIWHPGDDSGMWEGQVDSLRYRSIIAPLWLIALLFGAYPLFAAYRLYRNRPPPPGHCLQCRYNLTGNTSGRCPECGSPVKQDAQPSAP